MINTNINNRYNINSIIDNNYNAFSIANPGGEHDVNQYPSELPLLFTDFSIFSNGFGVITTYITSVHYCSVANGNAVRRDMRFIYSLN